MYKDVEAWVCSCIPRKRSINQYKAPLLPILMSSSWKVAAADCRGSLTTSLTGDKYIFVMCDLLSKYWKAVALPKKDIPVAAQAFLDMISIRHGPRRRFITDRGINFTSKTHGRSLSPNPH